MMTSISATLPNSIITDLTLLPEFLETSYLRHVLFSTSPSWDMVSIDHICADPDPGIPHIHRPLTATERSEARKTKLQELSKSSRATNQRLDEMAVQMSAITAELGAVKTKLGTVETKLGTVETKLGTVETKLGTVETKLGTVETKLGTVETKLGTVETKLGTVETELKEHLRATKDYMAQGLENEVEVFKTIETFEIINGILQMYNDRVVDVHGLITNNGPRTELTLQDKDALKSMGLGYITRYINFDTTKNSPTSRLVKKALACLSKEEIGIALGRDLRSALQYPRPHLASVTKFIHSSIPEHAQTLLPFLQLHSPRCLPSAPGTEPKLLFSFTIPTGLHTIMGKRAFITKTQQQLEKLEG
ncbi:hypothetical protein C8J56DRAFT_959730 [Mycena floridula]|nr:hypothetical protein C8J56DRAFT_959730 [Mycena floridula]